MESVNPRKQERNLKDLKLETMIVSSTSSFNRISSFIMTREGCEVCR